MTKLSAMIPRRRSVREYRPDPIQPETLAKVEAFLGNLTPLTPGAGVTGRIIPAAHGNFIQKWKTPHFIAIFSEPTDEGLMNAGFMFQQLDLYAQSLGLGSCWVGLGSLTGEEKIPEGMKLAVMMAIGNPDVPERAGAADFKRKALADLSDLPDDRLEPLRLAPSATNSQPWYVTHEGERLHIWREELGLIKQRTHGRMNKIDMGIGLCHLWATQPGFRFERLADAPRLNGRIYVGTVTL